jgi:hypothetical protein
MLLVYPVSIILFLFTPTTRSAPVEDESVSTITSKSTRSKALNDLKESVVSWKFVGTSLKRLERCGQEGKTALGKDRCSCKNNPLRCFKDEVRI